MSITIVVADEHDLFRRSLVMLLRSWPEVAVVGECADLREATDLVGRLRPAVVIFDPVTIAAGGHSGIDALSSIGRACRTTRIIILSNYSRKAEIRRALERGAVGYISKGAKAEELIQAIRLASRRSIHLSAGISAVLKTDDGTRDPGAAEDYPGGLPLSPREREVLLLIARGHSSKAIAEKLGVSEATVKSHRKHIMEKLNVHNTAGLTRYAINTGLIRN